MLATKLNTAQIKQLFKGEQEQALLCDKQTLALFSKDFGQILQSSPAAVYSPKSVANLQKAIAMANQHNLPVTIRGGGMSQSGQSLPPIGGLTLDMTRLNKTLTLKGDSIWVEANASWRELLTAALKQDKVPFVVPYNCNLSVAGVLSAGGVGASAFKYGSITRHVAALEVVTADGEKQIIEPDSNLFHACLSGQGRFGVITKVCLKLRPCRSNVRTFFLMYHGMQQWLDDILNIQQYADYLELFCSPSVQGAKLVGDKRIPFAHWLYGLHVSFEYDNLPSELVNIIGSLKPSSLLHTQDEPISSYLFRHDMRFEAMKRLGQWDLAHPWYECFVTGHVIAENLEDILQSLPLYYANLIQIVPIASHRVGFFMLPEEGPIYALMILNPGINEALKPSCLQAINILDDKLLALGGKRYLSGYLGHELSDNYWKKHFGSRFNEWESLKRHYDPKGIFQSLLHPN